VQSRSGTGEMPVLQVCMPGVIRTHFLPQLVEPHALAGGTTVIIDQLRASTTICAALQSGATRVVPFLEPEHALHAKEHAAAVHEVNGPLLLGGERGGVLIPGFDLDNSPRRYTPEVVGGKVILFTTTNGTKAVQRASESAAVLIGCLGNLSALAAAIGGGDAPMHLLCAGTRDRVTLEDVLAAGAIAETLIQHGRATSLPDARDDDDSTLIALDLWRTARQRPNGILEALLASRGGRNLSRLGFYEDIAFCATIDNTPVVPWLSPEGSFVDGEKWA
jgi:2-phosphosulfolactate phosphatase